jgi:predicted AAA+ superfamily ATPase
MRMFYEKFEKEAVWVSFEEFIGVSFKSVDEFLYFLRKETGKTKFKYIFLDEIQLVPGISWILKKLYDDPQYDYLILCSGS